jgi:hypothetical protein
MAFNCNAFRWTEELSLRDFIDIYKHKLPKLLRTTTGFSDVDNMHDIGSDEVSHATVKTL